MKALLLLLAVITLTMTGCAVPYEVSYGYQSYRPAYRSYYQSNRPYCDGYQTYTVGPQYHRAYDNNCNWGNTRYRNYSDAPVIVNRPGGNIVVPRSWN